MDRSLPALDRSRVGWWLLVVAIVAIVAVGVLQFLSAFVLGLFVYYVVRPVDRWLRRLVRSPGLAAALTLVLIALPILGVAAYVVSLGLQQFTAIVGGDFRQFLRPYVDVSAFAFDVSELASEPRQLVADLRGSETLSQALSTGQDVLAVLGAVLLRLFLALAFVFYLLRDDYRLAGWFRSAVGGPGSVAHAYASAVDRDLESVYLGNILTIVLVAVLSALVYSGYNELAPTALAIPIPMVLALFTGLAGLIPIVVGKVVYVPLALYLSARAVQVDASLTYPLGFTAVAFVVLDTLPMTFIQPYLAGRRLHVGLMLFAYILGVAIFGWYGLFLGPLILVLLIQAVRIVLPELLSGEALTPHVTSAAGIGSNPRTDAGVEAGGDAGSTDGPPAGEAASAGDASPEDGG
ncbi:AI-2E family transporter [Halobacteriales archaeon QS_4_69_34]|nr:MAG: AI-2E family transporter [Halobacteriales archaeon QS_4_69_34]